MTKEDVLKQCTVEGNVVKLPAIKLERKLYQEVAKALELIGGKWKGGKIYGFVFPSDPTELLKQISEGEQRNLKKEFQFFATPPALADELVRVANFNEKDTILEPSAGQGAIINAINRVYPTKVVDCFELMPVNTTFLKKIPTANIVGDDFLKEETKIKYDCIIANPPFANNQDIEHVKHMYNCLAEHGRIVTITSKHWDFASGKKEKAFKQWLSDLGAVWEPIESGTFVESGTKVGGMLLIIDK